jgi:hypothetical protein
VLALPAPEAPPPPEVSPPGDATSEASEAA